MSETTAAAVPSPSSDERTTSRKPEDDPRFRRSRAKLTQAILHLAAEQPAETISVSDLTSTAHVSRTTFYKHAASPAAFLATYLIEQMRPAMEPLGHLLDDTGPGYLLRWRQVHLDLLSHVRANEDVYRHVFSADGQSVVLAMLSAYFEQVFGAYVRDFRSHVDGPLPSDLWVAMAISQQVHNTIALISSWLRTGLQEDAEGVVSAYVSLIPPWQFARFSESGRTTLRQSHGRELLHESDRITIATSSQSEVAMHEPEPAGHIE